MTKDAKWGDLTNDQKIYCGVYVQETAELPLMSNCDSSNYGEIMNDLDWANSELALAQSPKRVNSSPIGNHPPVRCFSPMGASRGLLVHTTDIFHTLYHIHNLSIPRKTIVLIA